MNEERFTGHAATGVGYQPGAAAAVGEPGSTSLRDEAFHKRGQRLRHGCDRRPSHERGGRRVGRRRQGSSAHLTTGYTGLVNQ